MDVLLMSSDLMLTASLEHSARRVGGVLRSVGDVDQAVQRCASGSVRLIVVDLALPKLDLETLLRETRRATSPAPTVLAFAPHVHEDALQRARDVGCDEVVSRGSLERTVAATLERLAQESP